MSGALALLFFLRPVGTFPRRRHGVLLGHFVLGAQAFEVSFQLLLNLGVVAIAMDAEQFIGILAEVE